MEYWNAAAETMPHAQLKEIQFKRFRHIFTHAWQNSSAYRQYYERYHITPDDLQSYEDIRKVPLTDKSFIAGSMDTMDVSVYGDALAVPEENIVFYHQTSGTTSRPVAQPDSLFDWYFQSDCCARNLWAAGLRPEDRVLIAFNYNLFIGFWECHYACEKIGCEIIPGGSLTTEMKIEKIQQLGVTALLTTPSYAFRIAEAAQKAGVDLKNSTVKRLVLSGEPGGLVEGVRNRLEEVWGAEIFDIVGSTEVGAWGFECGAHPGGVHVDEYSFLPEIIEFDSEEPVTEPGREGRLVLTSLFRTARPCIRFNTNDIACWSTKPCSCGRHYRVLDGGVRGRCDHILKVCGTFVNPVVIGDVVQKYEKCSQEYQIIVHEDNCHITVRAEAAKGVGRGEFKGIASEISRRIHNATFMKMDVVIAPYGAMDRTEHKAKRVVDLRR